MEVIKTQDAATIGRPFTADDDARMLQEVSEIAEETRYLVKMNRSGDCIGSGCKWQQATDDVMALERARDIAKEQAEDEGLWCLAATAMEAHLQQELRRLTAAVEGE